jgi:hypothetical protein
MKVKLYVNFLLLFLVFCVSTHFAQKQDSIVVKEKKFDVEITNGNPLNIKSAQLDKVVVRKDKELSELFQLSFLVPNEFGELLSKSKASLTAYNNDGSVFGMRIWKSLPTSEFFNRKDSVFPVSLEVSSDFERAANFSLNIQQLNTPENSAVTATTCTECVELAKGTCGAGKVASVKCGRTKDSESCEFTCKP